ncbi:MAG: ABC transporter substrate-binding protein, partial [Deltaproteobacteria bacterium]|nr:ABC transporter substrate-binding protein [Deltaproteobacteria bacterium]
MFKLLNKTFALLAICILALAVAEARAAAPTEVAKEVINKALDILNNPANAGPAKKNYRHQLVKQIVDRHFDYREMAKRSLGPTWNKLNSAQRDEFIRLFAELLEASYSDKIDRYAKHVRIDYTGESLDGEYAEVRTVVVRPNDRIPLNYRLLNESGQWMVYDVVIEGVSLVSNYRTQFSRIISESSYAGLLKRLRTRVNEQR